MDKKNSSWRMFLNNCRCLPIFVLLISYGAAAQKSIFPIVTKTSKISIVYDNKAPRLDSISAYLLAEDIERVTSFKPKVITDIAKAKGNVIVIGAIQSPLMQKFVDAQSVFYKKLIGKWESFGFTIVDKPLAAISRALVIAGSDARGTAYGVFTLSEKIGVSPWYWWADVLAKKQTELTINHDNYVSSAPAVKYRGIFINDEDWGLQPWAAKTFEPETGDVGPKTYAKVFELLLRLKANTLWPARHEVTKPFNSIPANRQVADDYAIVMGSSHAEPMLRNNVGEWKADKNDYNFRKNPDGVTAYWEERVKESGRYENIYTIGMRGIHDSPILGTRSQG